MSLDLSKLLAKPEAAPGTAVVPSPAANAMMVQNLAITPFNSTALRRAIDLPFPGARPSIPTAIHGAMSFDVELAGSGVVDTPAFWSALLNMCMFGAPVPSAGVQVAYPLASIGDGGANTLYGYKDNAVSKLYGARANVVFDFTEKQLPKMSFAALGLILNNAPMIPEAAGALVLPAAPAPVEVNNANTAISLGGFTLGCQSVKIDMGMKTALYSTTGTRAIIFDKSADADRRGAKLTIVAELPDLAAVNYFAAASAGTAMVFNMTHGTIAGNFIGLSAGNVVLSAVALAPPVNNRVFVSLTGDLVPNGPGNEFFLSTR